MTYQKKIIKPKHFELIFTLLFVGCASIPNGLSNHKFDNDFKNTNLINGGWHLFGRENKIEHIMKNFY